MSLDKNNNNNNNPLKCNYRVKKVHPVFRAYRISRPGRAAPPTLLLLCQTVAVLSPGAEPAAVPAAAQSPPRTRARSATGPRGRRGAGGARGRRGVSDPPPRTVFLHPRPEPHSLPWIEIHRNSLREGEGREVARRFLAVPPPGSSRGSGPPVGWASAGVGCPHPCRGRSRGGGPRWASPVRLGSLAQPQRRGTSPSSVSSGQYFGPRFGAQCPERGREEAGSRRVLASLYWEGPSELPQRRSSSSAPRRDSAEPWPRGCSGLDEPC